MLCFFRQSIQETLGQKSSALPLNPEWCFFEAALFFYLKLLSAPNAHDRCQALIAGYDEGFCRSAEYKNRKIYIQSLLTFMII